MPPIRFANSHLSRRDLLKASLAIVPMLAACTESGETDAPLSAARFEHGVASGDPTADRVILWTRATPPTDAGSDGEVVIDWLLARDPALSDIVLQGRVKSDAAADHTIKLDAAGLAPGTVYWYRFTSATAASPIGRTRTAPVGAVDHLRFAFVTCADFSRGFYNAYRRVAERDDLQAVVHLGDYIYENGAQDRVRPHQPPREIVSLADYRERYAQVRGDADLQAMHGAHPMIWVWDDHEVANNAWRDGAEAHDPATQGSYADRRAMAFRAAHEWLPIRTPEPGNLARVYRAFSFGDLADLTMIDARHIGRDQPVPPNTVFGDSIGAFTQTGAFADPARQILGVEQEAWLGRQLAASKARWQLLGNQVYFSPLKLLGAPRASNLSLFVSNDKWDGYEPARDRVLAMLDGLRNPLILTGDAHEAYAFDVTPDPNSLSYNALSGEGSRAVEFVVTSTTSRGDAPEGLSISGLLERLQTGITPLLRLSNPHLKYLNNRLNGYLLLDLTPARAQAEFWTVPMVSTVTDEQSLDAVWICDDRAKRLRRG